MPWGRALKDLLQNHSCPQLQAFRGVVSSVLIPIGRNRQANRDEILLTKRTLTVDTHKGHVSFPGGLGDTKDRDLIHTALRESEEEIGVRPEDIEVIGGLAPVSTRDSIVIYPWIGRMTFPYAFKINPQEVDRLIYLPVSELLERGLKSVEVKVGAINVKSIGLHVDGELVWGATARMLEQLRECFLAVT